jgi:hypothetical protein
LVNHCTFADDVARGKDVDRGFVAGQTDSEDAHFAFEHDVQLAAGITLVKDELTLPIVSERKVLTKYDQVSFWQSGQEGNGSQKGDALGQCGLA